MYKRLCHSALEEEMKNGKMEKGRTCCIPMLLYLGMGDFDITPRWTQVKRVVLRAYQIICVNEK